METSNLIDGKAAAQVIREKLVGHDAALAVVVVGENAASKVYVRNKKGHVRKSESASMKRNCLKSLQLMMLFR